MTRMNNILDRTILEYLNNLETNPHDAIAFLAIGDFLYGETVNDVRTAFSVESIYFFKENFIFFSLKPD